MGAVLGVEVVKVGDVLEVVCVDLAALNDVVGLDIVGVLDDFEGDVLLGEDVLCYLEYLGVRRGGGCDGDGLAAECCVVNAGIEAVARVFNDAHDGAAVGFGDEVCDLLALESRLEGLDLVAVFVAFLDCEDVAVCRGGAFDREGILNGVYVGCDGVVGVDDGVIDVLKNIGKLRGFNFAELDVVGVVGDVLDGGGYAGVLIEGDVAEVLEQKQGAGFVGGVVGNCDLDGVAGVAAAAAAGGQSEEREGKNDGENNGYYLFHDICLLKN